MKLHRYFKDYAVIQANQTFYVKGTCAPDRAVRVTIERKTEKREFFSVSDENGNFSVACDAFQPSFSEYDVTVCGGDERVTIRRVTFGDVVLALGQSNIELKLKYLQNYEKTVAEYGGENFRFLDVPNVAASYDGKDISGFNRPADDFLCDCFWAVSSDAEKAAETFGFSYLLAGELQRKTNYPVAVINLAVGGSGFAHWLARETIASDPALLRAYGNTLPQKDGETSVAGCLYCEKIAPLNGFAVKGAVWYLGESSAWEGFELTSAIAPSLRALVKDYRAQLRGGLPMVVMHVGMQSYGAFSVNYANEQFDFACEELGDLVSCPLFDLSHQWIRPDGDEMYHPIHLVEKTEHARRAAMLFYENFIAKRAQKCPRIANVAFENGYALCTVETDRPLRTRDELPPYGFALAESDGKYVTAQAELVNENTVKVFSPFLNDPRKLTYGFFAYNNNCNVTNGILPLLPYRTDFENADGLPYAVFLAAFACRFEKFYENAFSALGGGAGFKNAHTVSALFGDRTAKLYYDERGVTLSMRYCPQEACFAGLSPELLVAGQPHRLERYNKLCLELTPEKELQLIGIHFRTCEGEQFYLVPFENGKEQRNLLLAGGKKHTLFFDLNAAVDRKECSFPLDAATRSKIALMQITFRNREPQNAVTVHNVTCYYGEPTAAPREDDDGRKSMYVYGN